MTAGCYYLVLIDVASAADMSACGILGGIDDTVTHVHICLGELRCISHSYCLSGVDVILGLLEWPCLSTAFCISHFGLLLTLCFTLVHPNISTSGSTATPP